MIVALDDIQDRAVLGINIDERTVGQRPSDTTTSDRYSCLLCGSDLSYSPGPNGYNHFEHDDTDCFKDGNISENHRLVQEVICKEIFNSLSMAGYPIQLDTERRIGGVSNFVVTDVRVLEPTRLAVEVIHLNEEVSLRRRLKKLFAQDYKVMLICHSDSRVAPDEVERHLSKISPTRVGCFDQNSLSLTLGSIITPSQIDPAKTRWDLLPNYLS